MAQSGSLWVMAVNAFADSRYQNECRTATAWSKGFCTAGLQETGKLTLPIRSSGSIPCCDHVAGTVSASATSIATSPTTVFITGIPPRLSSCPRGAGTGGAPLRVLRPKGGVLRRPALEQLGIGLLGDAGHPRRGDLAGAAQHDLGLADVVRVEIR